MTKSGKTPSTKLQKLLETLRSAHRRQQRMLAWAMMLSGLAVVIGGFLILLLLEKEFFMPAAVKITLGVLMLAGAVAVAFLLRKRHQSRTFQQFYSRLSDELELPPLKYAVDLDLHARNRGLSLHQAAIDHNIRDLPEQELGRKIKDYLKNSREKVWLRTASLSTILAFTLLVAGGFLAPDAMNRSALFWQSFEQPNPFSFTIIPGDTTIEQGTVFRPKIRYEGTHPGELSLALRTEVEKQFRYRPMEPQTGDTYLSVPVSLNTSAEYFVLMDGFQSERHRVNVQLRPRFETLSVIVTPPSYTGLDTSRFEYPFHQVQAYEGSELKIKGRVNKPVDRVDMISTGRADTIGLDVADNTVIEHRLEADQPDTHYFDISDRSGLTNKNRFEFNIKPLPDEYPFVELAEPAADLELNEPQEIAVTYEAGDDFGLTSARLRYELQKAFTPKPVEGSVRLKVPELNRMQEFTWDLPSLDPGPRDMITFWIEVADNDAINGYKTSRSAGRMIRFPSLVDQMDELENRESDVKETLEDLSESQEQMRREYEQFKNRLKENPNATWEQKRSLDEVRKKQEDIEKEVEDLNKKFEEIRREIGKSDQMSKETLEAYDELQKLMKEIDDPELLKALEEIRNALDNMNQQQLQKALEEFEFSEEQYRERLQRTVELFKTLKMNSDLDKIARALDNLAEQEQELSESEEPPSEQIERQEAIKKDTEKVSEQLKELGEDPPESQREQVDKLEQDSQQQLEQIQKQLQENIEKMQQDRPGGDQRQNRQEIRDQQQQIQQQMKQMAQQMRNARQQMNRQRMQVNMGALQNILYTLINLSIEQEELTEQTEGTASRSQAFVERARTQERIRKQFEQIADSLYRVSAEIPGFGNRINEKKQQIGRDLGRSVEQLSERNKSQSTYAERQSLGGINELASMVASLMDQLQNQMSSGMGGGGMTMQQFIEQMRKMSGEQQMLNQRIQDMINDIQGDRLSRDQIDRLNQMARQQNRIRKQLRELQQKGQLESGDRVLSELERMMEQMEDTINELRGGQLDKLMIERQQNILSRMLEAEKALEERGEEEKREGTAAEDPPRATPPDVTLEELQKKLRSLLNDPNRTKFSEDYQRLIEQYFELLKKLQERESS